MDLMVPRLEKFANEGLFGEINVLRVGPSSNDAKSAQFQSQLGFFNVDLVTRKGKVRKVPVVAKLQPDVVPAETQEQAYAQFANEVVTYQKVLPELGATQLGLHPVLYFGHATKGEDPKQDLLIIEDLRPQGFKVPQEPFLDPDHIKLALRRLGEFHGLSYKMKIDSPDKFNQLKNQLTIINYQYGDGIVKTSILRALQKDLESNPKYSILHKAYKKLTSLVSDELIRLLQEPEEPFAAVVHGDFVKNNILYKYDENGMPSDVKFLDFQTTKYSDPTIDLAVFLYMHTSHERDAHWNDLLKSYWNGLLSIGDPGFTFEQLIKNFAKKAVYGFIISSFFLPFMQNPEGLQKFGAGFADLTEEEGIELASNYGGEESTAAVVSIVRHLHQEGYLEEYLLHFKQ